jgi:hypothetical protein
MDLIQVTEIAVVNHAIGLDQVLESIKALARLADKGFGIKDIIRLCDDYQKEIVKKGRNND